MDHQFVFPSSGLLPAADKLTCPQCGRDAVQIFHCPDRKHDTCPFVRRWSGRKGSVWSLLAVVGFLGLWAAAMFRTSWMLWVVPTVGLLAWLATTDLQLYKPKSGIMLERTSVFGLAVRIRVLTKRQMVSLPFTPGSLPPYPLSVVALGGLSSRVGEEEYRATCVFRAALVELLARDLIALQPVTICIPGRNGTARSKNIDCYVIGKSSGLAAPKLGWLETAILQAVARGAMTQTGRDGWLDGPRVYEVVRAYFENDRSSPSRELLQGVENNAAALGLCRVEPARFLGIGRKVTWAGPQFEAMQADHKVLEDLEAEFMHTDPELWSGLFSEISKGIKSRIDSGD